MYESTTTVHEKSCRNTEDRRHPRRLSLAVAFAVRFRRNGGRGRVRTDAPTGCSLVGRCPMGRDQLARPFRPRFARQSRDIPFSSAVSNRHRRRQARDKYKVFRADGNWGHNNTRVPPTPAVLRPTLLAFHHRLHHPSPRVTASRVLGASPDNGEIANSENRLATMREPGFRSPHPPGYCPSVNLDVTVAASPFA
ncbi:hypothetical protein GWI33_022173 [Rhynchophorus ferrugineus]|uniref:Uncharacterized protein n=1 Tax=Rhynchophorus ferrugineus TaxID=354439 RepID=A0A834MJ73_RHYFE|nr:hypothetical protein GWI33_022173 [Rhynchophorus ferrugineus]